ncbi:MAG TPA: hypothetical protein VMH86_08410 [Rhizomicrobium sp.]|nr:hypothetical protein [Rhizomicrobium sp.]
MDRNLQRLLIGLGGLVAGATIVFAVFLLELPRWIALGGPVLFIICANYSQLLLPFTSAEREERDQKILAEGEDLRSGGLWRYSLRLAIPAVLSFIVAMISILWKARSHLQIATDWLWPLGLVCVVFAFVFAVGTCTYWWHSRRARLTEERRRSLKALDR